MRKQLRKSAERARIQAAEANPGSNQPAAIPLKRKRDESSYHKGSCEMHRVDPSKGERAREPGDFYWLVSDQSPVRPEGYRSFAARYPDGSFAIIEVRPAHPDSGGPSWSWDGNLERPTLSPSVHHIGHWHGYVRAGRMISV